MPGAKIVERRPVSGDIICAAADRRRRARHPIDALEQPEVEAVAPTAIYARTTSKDALFLAVYEHGIAEMLAEQQVFTDDARWAGLSPAELIRVAALQGLVVPEDHGAH